jgi:hypothetical protein
MPVTATTSEEIVVGAGELWKDGAPVGATQDDTVFRLNFEWFVPDLNSVAGPLMGTDYLVSETAEIEASIPEISAANLALLVPGATSTTRSTTATSGGLATTLAAAVAAGQYLAIKLASVTDLEVGDYIRFGASGSYEYRKVTRVGTALAGGTGIDIDFPVVRAHASGAAAVQTDGDGSTIISGTSERRLPTSAYHDYVLEIKGLDGRAALFYVYNAIMVDSPEFSSGDDSNMAPRLKVQARRDPATVNTPAWDIVRRPAIS